MDRSPKVNSLYSRREVLKRIPLALGGAFILTAVSARLLKTFSQRRRQPAFPKGSIFTPANRRQARGSGR